MRHTSWKRVRKAACGGRPGRSALTRACLLLAIVGGSWPSLVRADDVVPADAPPRWWKGNLHTHTVWSDGDDFPEMVAEWYRTHGYHFLAFSEHNLLARGPQWRGTAEIANKAGPQVIEKYLARFGSSWVETRDGARGREIRLKPLDEFRALVEERGRFLLLAGEEITDTVAGLPVHMNASNIHAALQPVGGATVRDAMTANLRAVHEQAERAGQEILVHLNHPNYHFAVTAEDLASVVLERHFEVYNGISDSGHLGDDDHPGVERLWDIANTIRLVDLNAAPLFGIATDDSHNYHGKPGGARPGRGWTMVRSTHLTPEYIVRAIKAGDCYASTGVTLSDVHYDAESRRLELRIEPDGAAAFTTEFIGTKRGVDATGSDPAPATPPVNDQPVRLTRRYSDQIGAVLAMAEGLRPAYVLTGDELYVRAVVTSDQPPVDPSFEGQKRQAWTQPVGWKLGAGSRERPIPSRRADPGQEVEESIPVVPENIR